MIETFYCPWEKEEVILSQEAKPLYGNNRMFPDTVQYTPLKCSKRNCTRGECICLDGNKDPRKEKT